MSAQVFHSIATQFRDRYLNPLQFRRGNSVEDRVSALEQGRSGQAAPGRSKRTRAASTPAQRPTASPAAPREDIRRVGEDFASDNHAAAARDSLAASDLLHTFNARMSSIQAQTKPSTTGGWGAYNDVFGPGGSAHTTPAPKPSAPAAPMPVNAPVKRPAAPRQEDMRLAATSAPRPPRESAPQVQHAPEGPPSARPSSGRGVQRGLFPASQVAPKARAQRQAKETPAPSGPGRGQTSLFPKRAVAVNSPSQFPQASQPSVSAEGWNSMLRDSVAEHQASKKSRGFPAHREIG